MNVTIQIKYLNRNRTFLFENYVVIPAFQVLLLGVTIKNNNNSHPARVFHFM